MSDKLFAVLSAVLATAFLAAATVVTRDVIQFHEISVVNTNKTLWYEASWLKQPYTNLRLSTFPVREYWTVNAIQSERWLVREIEVGGVTFWTTLRREPTAKS